MHGLNLLGFGGFRGLGGLGFRGLQDLQLAGLVLLAKAICCLFRSEVQAQVDVSGMATLHQGQESGIIAPHGLDSRPEASRDLLGRYQGLPQGCLGCVKAHSVGHDLTVSGIQLPSLSNRIRRARGSSSSIVVMCVATNYHNRG